MTGQPPYGYPPYQPGQYPPPPPPQQPGNYGQGAYGAENKVALWAMICGCLIFLCGVFTGIPALILGIIGLKKSKELGGEGKGKSIAGIALGSFSIVAFALYIILVVFVGISSDGDSLSLDEGRNSGEQVSTLDASISNENVEISESYLVTFTADITNESDSASTYVVDVKCEGGDQTETTTVETDEVQPSETGFISAELQFDSTDSGMIFVNCITESVTYK